MPQRPAAGELTGAARLAQRLDHVYGNPYHLPGNTSQPGIGGDEGRLESYRQGDIQRIAGGDISAQVPGNGKERRAGVARDGRMGEQAEPRCDKRFVGRVVAGESGQRGEHFGVEMGRRGEGCSLDGGRSTLTGRRSPK